MADRPNSQPIPRVRDEGWIVGKLIAHGPAPYQHDPAQSMSYFMRLQTLETEQGALQRSVDEQANARPLDGHEKRRGPSAHQGGVRELWSKDLKRAIRESKSGVDIGTIVAAKVVAREPLEHSIPARDKSHGDIHYRNRWEVETPKFIAQRNRFAHAVNENYQQARRDGVEGKEALGLYLIHAGARAVAAERYANPEDRDAFVERVRQVVESSPDREKLIAQAVARLKATKAVAAPAQNGPSQARPTHGRHEDPLTR